MKNLFFVIILMMALAACNKDEDTHHPCYDKSLVHNGACPTDCPGFEGCDGNTYCNACEAARHGIGPM